MTSRSKAKLRSTFRTTSIWKSRSTESRKRNAAESQTFIKPRGQQRIAARVVFCCPTPANSTSLARARIALGQMAKLRQFRFPDGFQLADLLRPSRRQVV